MPNNLIVELSAQAYLTSVAVATYDQEINTLEPTIFAKGLATTLPPAAIGAEGGAGAAAGSGAGAATGTGVGVGVGAGAASAEGGASAEKSLKAATSSVLSMRTIIGVPTGTSGLPAGTRIFAKTASSCASKSTVA